MFTAQVCSSLLWMLFTEKLLTPAALLCLMLSRLSFYSVGQALAIVRMLELAPGLTMPSALPRRLNTVNPLSVRRKDWNNAWASAPRRGLIGRGLMDCKPLLFTALLSTIVF